VKDLQLEERVRFLPSFTDAQRGALLAACTAVVYTPQHEHFGIVPLEAMAAGRPVIAVNNGGPTESVAHGRTGLLCDPTPAAFAAAYKQLLEGATTNNSSISSSTAAPMGRSAREHVKAKFSRQAFGDQLDSFVKQLATDKRNTGRSRR
jgi:alpha-1,3/alpha-1,6-mannosyltransferase